MKNELYDYIKTKRGVGHTRLLIDGAQNAKYPFLVVGADMRHANIMVRELGNEFAIPTTIDKERDYRGHSHPVLIDNYAFTSTCEAYMREMRDTKDALIKAKETLAKKESTIENISKIPLWIRLFKPLYKRAIKRHNS